jgi:ribosomal protein L36
LATRRNSLRQITNSLLLRNRSRRNRHILVLCPDPKQKCRSASKVVTGYKSSFASRM